MADTQIKENCSNCKYFFGDNVILGVCKRYPVTANKHDADWCGEFIAKPKEITPEDFKGAFYTMPELAEAAEGLMGLSVEPKKRGRKPKNA